MIPQLNLLTRVTNPSHAWPRSQRTTCAVPLLHSGSTGLSAEACFCFGFAERSFPQPAPEIPVALVCFDPPLITALIAECYPVLSRPLGGCAALPVSRHSTAGVTMCRRTRTLTLGVKTHYRQCELTIR